MTLGLFILSDGGEADTVYQHHKHGVYIAPADDLLVPLAEFRAVGVTIVSSVDEFLLWKAVHSQIDLVYFHPSIIDQMDDKVFQELADKGTALITLNTPISVLGQKLHTGLIMPDLRPEYYISSQYFTLALVKFENQPSSIGPWVLADFFKPQDFKLVVSIIENNLNS